jgi:hypothetical protein
MPVPIAVAPRLISRISQPASCRRAMSSLTIVGRELLAERHRHGVLQLGAADLEQIGELVGLLRERVAQVRHRLEQLLDREAGRDADRGRVDVVGALARLTCSFGCRCSYWPVHAP